MCLLIVFVLQDGEKLPSANSIYRFEAIPKARHIYEDERRLSTYDQVENLCKSILQNFSPSMRQSVVNLLLEETKEAMAGLIFAGARIGELKELQHIRNLFVERFGFEFDKDSVDLRPGNFVSSEIIKILDTRVSQKVLGPKFVNGIISQIDQTNADSDAVKIEKPKTVGWRKKVMKENSKFLYPNLRESKGRDRS